MAQRRSEKTVALAARLCAQCGALLKRHPKHSRSQWETKRYCPTACGNKARATHGRSKSRLYRVWAGIKQRCTNEKFWLYAHYGARGVRMSDAWLNDFEAFAEAIGPDPGLGYDVGRIDNDKGYEPGNIRWETRTENANNKRTTRWVYHDGCRVSLKQYCRMNGMSYKYIYAQLYGRKGILRGQ